MALERAEPERLLTQLGSWLYQTQLWPVYNVMMNKICSTVEREHNKRTAKELSIALGQSQDSIALCERKVALRRFRRVLRIKEKKPSVLGLTSSIGREV